MVGVRDIERGDSLGPILHLPEQTRLGAVRGAPAVFLDRDGVVLEDTDFVRSTDEVRVLPGVAEALKELGRTFMLIIVTNQSGIARGMFGEEDLLGIHAEMLRLLTTQGARLDAIYACPHLAEGKVERYRRVCRCRKPQAGMLWAAADDWGIDLKESFLVGDATRDIEAATAAGIRGIRVGKNRVTSQSGEVATGLAEAVAFMPAPAPREHEG